ncbi:trans-aconitate 2-methyltransferase [Sporichthya brevicatena]|uniref:Trans-aconitate 2-methyltransferase n=2 Tax=Sporichthya brevicatena TaxID=171442 RepID=A0ABN1HBJ1_9ACTN
MWDPQTYLAYADERTRPARDLLAAIDVEKPARVVDLGCGTGTSTRLLARRWPDADVLGTDSSPEMIAAAQAEPAEPGAAACRYEVADAYSWAPGEPVDVWFSNAMLQWLPGHLDRLPGWLRTVAPGGVLAFQVPGNFESPSHVLLREVTRSPAWRDRLAGIPERREAVESPARYADVLAAAGARPDVWETTYLHRLDGPDPVLRWTTGTALRPVLAVLGEDSEARAAFLAEYGAALRAAYPPNDAGTVTFPFRRIFVVARIPA